jgi:hypothetical protein
MKLINLADYRKKREEQELEDLKNAIDRIIEENGIEPQDPIQYEIYDPTKTIGTMTGDYDGILTEAELQSLYFDSSLAGSYPQGLSDIESCISSLNWVSSVLMAMGHFSEANKIDNIVVGLCNKPQDNV